jgi:hypothetical protein
MSDNPETSITPPVLKPADDDRMALVSAVRKALNNDKIHESDPAFLVCQALEMSLRVNEQIPQAIRAAAEAAKAEIAAAGTSRSIDLSKISEAMSAAVDAAALKAAGNINITIEKAASGAASKAARAGFDQAQKSLVKHQNISRLGAMAQVGAIMLPGFAFAFVLGEYSGERMLPYPSNWFAAVFDAPCGYPVIIMALVAAIAAGVTYYLPKP